jgi:hypothetical protein
MPLYTARVAMPRRLAENNDDGTTPHIMEEVLVDAIHAGSKRKAKKAALELSERHRNMRFPISADREQVPEAELIELVRLNKEGKPVNSSFESDAKITIRPLGKQASNCKVVALPAGTVAKKVETKTASKTGASNTTYTAATFPFDDPLTDEFILTVMEKRNEPF